MFAVIVIAFAVFVILANALAHAIWTEKYQAEWEAKQEAKIAERIAFSKQDLTV